MRVAIVDDQVLLREGLARLLAEAGMRVVASEGDIDGFLGAVDTSHPDVTIIDIRLPPTFTDDGLRAADLLRTRHPAPRPWSCRSTSTPAMRSGCSNPFPAGSATCSRTGCRRSRCSSTRSSDSGDGRAAYCIATVAQFPRDSISSTLTAA